MKIQGRFITELFKSLSANLKTLDTFMKEKDDESEVIKVKQAKSLKKVSGWGVNFTDYEELNESENKDPIQNIFSGVSK